jgi:hypothetical protein
MDAARRKRLTFQERQTGKMRRYSKLETVEERKDGG